jgi:hypothetical protein
MKNGNLESIKTSIKNFNKKTQSTSSIKTQVCGAFVKLKTQSTSSIKKHNQLRSAAPS